MNRWKRWTVSIRTRLDDVIGQIENHEAVVEEMIRDVQRTSARARVQLRRVQRDGNELRHQLSASRAAELEWRDRARKLNDENKERALECLRRSKQAAKTATQLELRVQEHERAEKLLQGDVKTVESQLSALRGRRNIMRTRQSQAEAISICAPPDDTLHSLENVFDRWDSRITEMESVIGRLDTIDEFEETFVSEEEEAALLSELHELRGER